MKVNKKILFEDQRNKNKDDTSFENYHPGYYTKPKWLSLKFFIDSEIRSKLNVLHHKILFNIPGNIDAKKFPIVKHVFF